MENVNYNNLNRWAISSELFDWVRDNLKEGSTILEFGSGTGTEELSKFYNVISVEQDERWVGYVKGDNVNYIHAEIKDGWYNKNKVIGGLKDKQYDLIIIDGPKGSEYRAGFDRNIDNIYCDVPIILDDTNRAKDKEHAVNLANLLDRDYTEYKGKDKDFVVIKYNKK